MPAVPPFDLAAFVPYQLAVAASHVSAAFAEAYRHEHGLSIPEWRVLAHLSQSEAVSVRDIQARVDMDKSKVSRAASRLEAAGLIAKAPHPDDGRLVALTLTAGGHALMTRLAPLAEAFQADLLDRLGPDAAPLRRALAALGGKP